MITAERIASLMVDNEIGVKHRVFRTYEVVEDDTRRN